MLEKIRNKIKNKRISKSIFWKLLFFAKDSIWKIWKTGMRQELEWWDKYLEISKRELWMEELIKPETRKNGFPQLLLPYIQEMNNLKGDSVNILDVGCGPLSPLVWGVDQNLFVLTAIDPLAKRYSALLEAVCLGPGRLLIIRVNYSKYIRAGCASALVHQPISRRVKSWIFAGKE